MTRGCLRQIERRVGLQLVQAISVLLLLLLSTPRTARGDLAHSVGYLEARPRESLDDRKLHSCGDPRWRSWYAEVVHRIREGSRSPRYLINGHQHTGISDRLVSTMTAFWFAVISNRAFEVYPYPGTHGLEVAYDWNYINATAHRSYDGWHQDEYRERHGWQWGDPNPENPAELMFYSTTMGESVRLFEKSLFRRFFYDIGIHPTTAFGCAFNYLLKPNQAVRDMFKDEFEVMENESILKIGIQIRMGDEHLSRPEEFDADEVMLREKSEVFFKCAEELEGRYLEPDQKAIWFLVTDSKRLRHHAQQVYGEKVITSTNLALHHSSRGMNFDLSVAKREDMDRVSDVGFQAAAGENWLFGLADYHIISRYSGYGRTAAFRSLRSNTIYTLATGGTEEGLSNCSLWTGFQRPFDASQDWSRI